jgi:hypothetical protein
VPNFFETISNRSEMTKNPSNDWKVVVSFSSFWIQPVMLLDFSDNVRVVVVVVVVVVPLVGLWMDEWFAPSLVTKMVAVAPFEKEGTRILPPDFQGRRPDDACLSLNRPYESHHALLS